MITHSLTHTTIHHCDSAHPPLLPLLPLTPKVLPLFLRRFIRCMMMSLRLVACSATTKVKRLVQVAALKAVYAAIVGGAVV